MHAPGLDRRWSLALAHAGLNQAALARRLGISSATISQMVSGRHPGTGQWAAIAEVLNVPVAWLLQREGPAPYWAEQESEPSRVQESGIRYNATASQPIDETNRLLGLLLERMGRLEERLSRLETAPTTALVRKGKVG